MKNLAIIITKLNGGGAERCASNLSIELSKRYNVKLLVFDSSNIMYPYGGELIDIGIGNSKGLFRKFINILRRIKKVKNIKKKFNIDCSISLLDGPNIVNVFSSYGEKTIVSIRNMISNESMGVLRKRLIKYTSKHSDITVSLSEIVRQDLVNNFNIPKEKITTIYNHCDAQLLKKLCSESTDKFEVYPTNVNYVTRGRLNAQKWQWHLIRAFQKVVKNIPNAHLYIMGEGELEIPLKNLVKELKLEKSITFTGYIKNPHRIYSQCETFLFPSLYEGLGNVLLEALAFDMPIISCDCDAGPREILAPDTDLQVKTRKMELAKYGVLVPVFDGKHFSATDSLTEQEECFADSIIFLHNNENVRQNYKLRARERMECFDKQIIMNKWSEVIEKGDANDNK